MKRNCRGFTLVELLVTISIITILSAIGLVLYSGTQVKARDSRRQQDLAQIQVALEQYYEDHGFYPALPNQPSGQEIYSGVGASKKTYLIEVPYDPKNSGIYIYSYEGTPDGCTNFDSSSLCTGYNLSVKSEGHSGFYRASSDSTVYLSGE